MTGLLVFAASLAAAGTYLVAGFEAAAVLALIGLGYGYVLHRGKLCFATAVYGFDLSLTRAILYGLLAASLGSYVLIDVAGLRVPAVPPASIHILLGSVLFGLGMPFAGGCMSGVMFRLGGGNTQSAVAFAGILVGGLLGIVAAWPIADYLRTIAGFRPYNVLGPGLSAALNIAIIAALLAYLYAREARALGIPVRQLVAGDLRSVRLYAAVALAALWLAQFAYHSALTTQVPLGRLVVWLSGIDPPETWLSFVGGVRAPFEDPLLVLIVALLAGSTVSALLHGEFAGFPRIDGRTAIMAFLGGLLMGFSVWLAIGCNLSGFWSAVASLRVDGWLYGLGIFIGGQLGLRLRARVG